jgi:glycosyltransferase involved in cell wall biosynthesis
MGKTLAECAPVVFLMGTLPEAQLQSLYRTATHYVSLSHGEGWDQVMMEAALSGLQLVAPRHTAYAEYLDDAHAHLVPSTLVPAVFEGAMGAEDRIFFDGLRWWQPDEDAAAETIRGILDGRAPRKASPAARLAEEYSWARAAVRLLETLDLAA